MLLQDLENIKVKGKNAPKPIKTWAQVIVTVILFILYILFHDRAWIKRFPSWQQHAKI